jgi:glutathione S-transferase
MIIYGATMSPFVRKALAFAAEAGIAVESRNIGLGSNDPEFLAASPFRKIPALRDGDYTLCDSSAIVQYLDALNPAAALIPTAAAARGKAIWWDEFADTIFVAAAGRMFFNRVVSPLFLKRPGDLAAADKAEAEELPPLLAYLESSIPAGGFLVEDRLTLADLAVASPFVNLAHAGHDLDAARYPKLAAHVAAILARPSFAGMVATEKRALGKS